METDVDDYGLYDLVQPVLWNYAEDLDMYLPRSTWMILKNFRRVWGSSAWKGADGPARFATHAAHYVKNHESWIKQLTMVYKDFEVVEGLIMTGWSRYDHLAVLAETVPVALPTLAMSMETILEARPMMGNFPVTAELLQVGTWEIEEKKHKLISSAPHRSTLVSLLLAVDFLEVESMKSSMSSTKRSVHFGSIKTRTMSWMAGYPGSPTSILSRATGTLIRSSRWSECTPSPLNSW